MIYISSACSKQKFIRQAVTDLVDQGFNNIELSGGTRYYDYYEKDLFELKEKYNLNFLVHNYFPPPQNPFILNLASLDQDIHEKSVNHLKKALNLTRSLGGKKFGVHAGFFVDRPVSEIGKKFGKSDLYDKHKALQNFITGFTLLKNEFEDITLYIENNCYSISNHGVYGDKIPFMLLTYNDFKELRNQLEFNLLLDIGHLMVSANTLHLDFEREFENMFEISDYIHVSDNNRRHDQNLGLNQNSQLVDILNGFDWKNKTVSLEIYNGTDDLKKTYSIVSSFKGRNL